MKEFIKSHKKLVIIIAAAIVFLIIAILLFNLFYVHSNRDVYGDRLDDLDTYLPSSEVYTKIKSQLEGHEIIDKASASNKGRIINIFVNVVPGSDREKVKELAKGIFVEFTQEQVRYFDFQFFITCETCPEEDTTFPFIGYRHKSVEEFSWSNN